VDLQVKEGDTLIFHRQLVDAGNPDFRMSTAPDLLGDLIPDEASEAKVFNHPCLADMTQADVGQLVEFPKDEHYTMCVLTATDGFLLYGLKESKLFVHFLVGNGRIDHAFGVHLQEVDDLLTVALEDPENAQTSLIFQVHHLDSSVSKRACLDLPDSPHTLCLLILNEKLYVSFTVYGSDIQRLGIPLVDLTTLELVPASQENLTSEDLQGLNTLFEVGTPLSNLETPGSTWYFRLCRTLYADVMFHLYGGVFHQAQPEFKKDMRDWVSNICRLQFDSQLLPGTQYCGTGYMKGPKTVDNPEGFLYPNSQVDACCLGHDFCGEDWQGMHKFMFSDEAKNLREETDVHYQKYEWHCGLEPYGVKDACYIPGFATKYGVRNPTPNPSKHVQCDLKFMQCLQGVRQDAKAKLSQTSIFTDQAAQSKAEYELYLSQKVTMLASLLTLVKANRNFHVNCHPQAGSPRGMLMDSAFTHRQFLEAQETCLKLATLDQANLMDCLVDHLLTAMITHIEGGPALEQTRVDAPHRSIRSRKLKLDEVVPPPWATYEHYEKMCPHTLHLWNVDRNRDASYSAREVSWTAILLDKTKFSSNWKSPEFLRQLSETDGSNQVENSCLTQLGGIYLKCHLQESETLLLDRCTQLGVQLNWHLLPANSLCSPGGRAFAHEAFPWSAPVLSVCAPENLDTCQSAEAKRYYSLIQQVKSDLDRNSAAPLFYFKFASPESVVLALGDAQVEEADFASSLSFRHLQFTFADCQSAVKHVSKVRLTFQEVMETPGYKFPQLDDLEVFKNPCTQSLGLTHEPMFSPVLNGWCYFAGHLAKIDVSMEALNQKVNLLLNEFKLSLMKSYGSLKVKVTQAGLALGESLLGTDQMACLPGKLLMTRICVALEGDQIFLVVEQTTMRSLLIGQLSQDGVLLPATIEESQWNRAFPEVEWLFGKSTFCMKFTNRYCPMDVPCPENSGALCSDTSECVCPQGTCFNYEKKCVADPELDRIYENPCLVEGEDDSVSQLRFVKLRTFDRDYASCLIVGAMSFVQFAFERVTDGWLEMKARLHLEYPFFMFEKLLEMGLKITDSGALAVRTDLGVKEFSLSNLFAGCEGVAQVPGVSLCLKAQQSTGPRRLQADRVNLATQACFEISKRCIEFPMFQANLETGEIDPIYQTSGTIFEAEPTPSLGESLATSMAFHLILGFLGFILLTSLISLLVMHNRAREKPARRARSFRISVFRQSSRGSTLGNLLNARASIIKGIRQSVAAPAYGNTDRRNTTEMTEDLAFANKGFAPQLDKLDWNTRLIVFLRKATVIPSEFPRICMFSGFLYHILRQGKLENDLDLLPEEKAQISPEKPRKLICYLAWRRSGFVFIMLTAAVHLLVRVSISHESLSQIFSKGEMFSDEDVLLALRGRQTMSVAYEEAALQSSGISALLDENPQIKQIVMLNGELRWFISFMHWFRLVITMFSVAVGLIGYRYWQQYAFTKKLHEAGQLIRFLLIFVMTMVPWWSLLFPADKYDKVPDSLVKTSMLLVDVNINFQMLSLGLMIVPAVVKGCRILTFLFPFSMVPYLFLFITPLIGGVLSWPLFSSLAHYVGSYTMLYGSLLYVAYFLFIVGSAFSAMTSLKGVQQLGALIVKPGETPKNSMHLQKDKESVTRAALLSHLQVNIGPRLRSLMDISYILYLAGCALLLTFFLSRTDGAHEMMASSLADVFFISMLQCMLENASARLFLTDWLIDLLIRLRVWNGYMKNDELLGKFVEIEGWYQRVEKVLNQGRKRGSAAQSKDNRRVPDPVSEHIVAA